MAFLVMREEKDRATVLGWVKAARLGTRVELKAPRRTLPQNDRMWAMLTDIVRQKKLINGQEFTTDQWKTIFLEAVGHELEYLPSLDGKRFVSYGNSSSALTVEQMTNLIEFIFAWGAENNVVWSDPQIASYEAMRR